MPPSITRCVACLFRERGTLPEYPSLSLRGTKITGRLMDRLTASLTE